MTTNPLTEADLDALSKTWRGWVDVEELIAEVRRLRAALNHESYCHDKAAQDRTNAERERDRLRARLKELGHDE